MVSHEVDSRPGNNPEHRHRQRNKPHFWDWWKKTALVILILANPAIHTHNITHTTMLEGLIFNSKPLMTNNRSESDCYRESWFIMLQGLKELIERGTGFISMVWGEMRTEWQWHHPNNPRLYKCISLLQLVWPTHLYNFIPRYRKCMQALQRVI